MIDDRRFWIYAAILLLVPVIIALMASTCMMMLVKIAVSMKSMASEAIYRKALRLSSIAKGSTSTGQLVNIMSSDTNSLLMFTIMMTIVVSVPLMVLFSFYLSYFTSHKSPCEFCEFPIIECPLMPCSSVPDVSP